MNKKKAALIILDGWGIGDGTGSDAIAMASTPCFDELMRTQPNSTLKTFGLDVGLPEGQMGNSEVGHMNIGAGRVVYQDLSRINLAVQGGELAYNRAIQNVIDRAKTGGKAVHLVGLLSRGGVHSSQDHLHALVDLLERAVSQPVYIHAFTDGRDTEPMNAVKCIEELESHLKGKRSKLVSVVGRYYGMDRDKRWERIKVAYDLLIHGVGFQTSDFIQASEAYYARGITDEFFEATLLAGAEGRIQEGDNVVVFNFRTDRCRQLVEALSQRDFPEFGMRRVNVHMTTMARYDEAFQNVEVVFEKENLNNTLGEVLAARGRSQLRMAETEKYPHVTFFFSGGREQPFQMEERIMVNSPKVATYDLKPEMSAIELTALGIEAILRNSPDFVCLNFANPDMVGHTGVYKAIVKAVETVDTCLKTLVETLRGKGYSILIIADHGNADVAIQPDGTPHTAHTMNPVPCILVADSQFTLRPGILADVAPTLLELMDEPSPIEMTGSSLLRK